MAVSSLICDTVTSLDRCDKGLGGVTRDDLFISAVGGWGRVNAICD